MVCLLDKNNAYNTRLVIGLLNEDQLDTFCDNYIAVNADINTDNRLFTKFNEKLFTTCR